jgi:hypothetical protein
MSKNVLMFVAAVDCFSLVILTYAFATIIRFRK